MQLIGGHDENNFEIQTLTIDLTAENIPVRLLSDGNSWVFLMRPTKRYKAYVQGLITTAIRSGIYIVLETIHTRNKFVVYAGR